MKKFIVTCPHSVFKPLKTGFISEDNETGRILYTTRVDESFVESIDRNDGMPIYLQEEVKKECDVRVTVVGQYVYAAKIHSQGSLITEVDWRKSTTLLPHEKINLPPDIQSKCLELCAQFCLDFAAIDFILDKNKTYWFLEVNPNGQWAWIEELLNYPISKDIVELLMRPKERKALNEKNN